MGKKGKVVHLTVHSAAGSHASGALTRIEWCDLDNKEMVARRLSGRNSEAAKHGRSKDLSPIRKFIKNRINRNPDISNAEMLTALDDAAENDAGANCIEFSDDKAAFIVRDEDGNPRFRLARQSVPRTISDLKKKTFRTLTG